MTAPKVIPQPEGLGPFEGPRYHENQARVKTPAWPCALCGKPVKEPCLWARVVDGGAAWGDPEDPNTDAGDMGLHRVGPDCARKLSKAGVPVVDLE